MRRTSLLALAIVLLPGTSWAQVGHLEEGTVPDSVRAEILGFLTSYYTTFSNRDWDQFEAHFWPGATITTVWQPPGEDSERVVVTTLPAFIEQAPEGPGSKEIFEERMLAARVHLFGNLATVFVRYRARFGDPGQTMEWEGTDSFSLLQHNGEWRIVALSFAADS